MLPLSAMASTKASSSKFDTRKNQMAFIIPQKEDEQRRDFILEPPLSKEKISNWVKQVLIPFSLSNKLFAFLGAYPTTKSQDGKVKNFFPSFPVTMLSAFEERSFHLSFIDKPTGVFRSAPPAPNKEYIAWLDKVQP